MKLENQRHGLSLLEGDHGHGAGVQMEEEEAVRGPPWRLQNEEGALLLPLSRTVRARVATGQDLSWYCCYFN